MNQYKWSVEYELYKVGSARLFYEDMEQLILKGLVDCVHPGKLTKTKNVYRLSDRWQRFGQDDYTVPLDVMTTQMRRQRDSNTN